MDQLHNANNPRYESFIMQACSTEMPQSDTPETDYKRTSNFSVKIQDDRMKNVIGCSVVNVTFPNVFSNVHSGNNVFAYCWALDTTVREVEITAGQYTSAELITAIQTAVNAEETDLKTAYSITAVDATNRDGKIRLTCSHQFYVLNAPRLSRMAGAAGSNAQKATMMAETIGCPGSTLLSGDYYYLSSSNVTGAHILTGSALPQLMGKQAVLLESNMFPTNLARASNTFDAVHIPITADYGASEIYQSTSEHETFVKYKERRNFNTVHFRLLDRMTKEPLDLMGHHLRVTLRVYTYN